MPRLVIEDLKKNSTLTVRVKKTKLLTDLPQAASLRKRTIVYCRANMDEQGCVSFQHVCQFIAGAYKGLGHRTASTFIETIEDLRIKHINVGDAKKKKVVFLKNELADEGEADCCPFFGSEQGCLGKCCFSHDNPNTVEECRDYKRGGCLKRDMCKFRHRIWAWNDKRRKWESKCMISLSLPEEDSFERFYSPERE